MPWKVRSVQMPVFMEVWWMTITWLFPQTADPSCGLRRIKNLFLLLLPSSATAHPHCSPVTNTSSEFWHIDNLNVTWKVSSIIHCLHFLKCKVCLASQKVPSFKKYVIDLTVINSCKSCKSDTINWRVWERERDKLSELSGIQFRRIQHRLWC